MTGAVTPAKAVYTHGHHESVLRSHRWRTAQNSAAYLLPRLRPGMHILDIGCGPGTITADLSVVVEPGQVVAVEISTDALGMAEAEAHARGRSNIVFVVGDVHSLDFPDATFDVVHAHQVLQHVGDPVGALREMRRVCKPAGVVAARDSDYASFCWFPESQLLADWLTLFHTVTTANGGEPDAGRRLLSWAQSAGFTEVAPSSTTWCFATPENRAWWGGLWAERTVASDFATQAVASGVATRDELAAMSVAWLEWAAAEDGWFSVMHGEIVCTP